VCRVSVSGQQYVRFNKIVVSHLDVMHPGTLPNKKGTFGVTQMNHQMGHNKLLPRSEALRYLQGRSAATLLSVSAQ